MGSKKRKKYMTPEEREYQGFKVPDKTDYKESALNPNREIRQEITRKQSYTERPQQQTYKSPGQQNISQQRSQQVYYHSQEYQGCKVPDKTDYKASTFNPSIEISEGITRKQSYTER